MPASGRTGAGLCIPPRHTPRLREASDRSTAAEESVFDRSQGRAYGNKLPATAIIQCGARMEVSGDATPPAAEPALSLLWYPRTVSQPDQAIEPIKQWWLALHTRCHH